MNTTNDNGSGWAMSQKARDFHWLLATFVRETQGVTEAVAVSSDGFLLASSSGPEREGIEQLAAIVSGLVSLSGGAAGLYGYGDVDQVIVEMKKGFFFVMSINDGSTIGALADKGADVGLIGFEMALLIDRVGTVLTPSLIDELKNSVATVARNS